MTTDQNQSEPEKLVYIVNSSFEIWLGIVKHRTQVNGILQGETVSVIKLFRNSETLPTDFLDQINSSRISSQLLHFHILLVLFLK